MNISAGSSTTSKVGLGQSFWQTAVILTLAFWLSSSLLLDLLIMPSLYVMGMMTEPGFTGAGYVIFGLFNRVELLCAALVLTGLLAIRRSQDIFSRRGYIGALLASFLLAIPLIYTYALTPQMSGLGLQLNLFEAVTEVPATMNQLHQSYWSLEALKLAVSGILLSLCYRERV